MAHGDVINIKIIKKKISESKKKQQKNNNNVEIPTKTNNKHNFHHGVYFIDPVLIYIKCMRKRDNWNAGKYSRFGIL